MRMQHLFWLLTLCLFLLAQRKHLSGSLHNVGPDTVVPSLVSRLLTRITFGRRCRLLSPCNSVCVHLMVILVVSCSSRGTSGGVYTGLVKASRERQ